MDSIQLHVKGIQGDDAVVTLASTDTVLDVKAAIGQAKRLSASEVTIIYRGVFLPDFAPVRQIAVDEGSAIHWVRYRSTVVLQEVAPVQTSQPISDSPSMFSPEMLNLQVAMWSNPSMVQWMSYYMQQPGSVQLLTNMYSTCFREQRQPTLSDCIGLGMQFLQSPQAQNYQEQLTQLAMMGFTNQEQNLAALQAANGDVTQAIARLSNND